MNAPAYLVFISSNLNSSTFGIVGTFSAGLSTIESQTHHHYPLILLRQYWVYLKLWTSSFLHERDVYNFFHSQIFNIHTIRIFKLQLKVALHLLFLFAYSSLIPICSLSPGSWLFYSLVRCMRSSRTFLFDFPNVGEVGDNFLQLHLSHR